MHYFIAGLFLFLDVLAFITGWFAASGFAFVTSFLILPGLAIWIIYLGMEPTSNQESSRFSFSKRIAWLDKKILNSSGNPKVDEWKKERASLKRKETAWHKKLVQHQKTQEETRQRIRSVRYAKEVICPHCQTKGKVHKRTVKQTEQTRQKGVVGAVIGVKTITTKGDLTELHCDNCDVKWTV